jgi:sec-independent protein translocase protein TatA
MGIGLPHLILLVVVVVLLFGRGKISDLMGDVAKGIKSFKQGLADDDVSAKNTVDGKIIEGSATREANAEAKDKSANS